MEAREVNGNSLLLARHLGIICLKLLLLKIRVILIFLKAYLSFCLRLKAHIYPPPTNISSWVAWDPHFKVLVKNLEELLLRFRKFSKKKKLLKN